MFVRLLSLVLALWLTNLGGAFAQTNSGLATLVADRVEIRNKHELVASGTVEVLFEGRRLRARQIVYNHATRQLDIIGPIILTDGAGSVVVADSASLDADLREGVLRSARVVLQAQLQIAANEVQRLGGRYTVAHRAVASSCQVCANDPTPLWEIRARRVIHDQQERQLYFENAQFRFAGLPLLYLPQLRMPDPTLKRARGFLMPLFSSSSQQGFGLAMPYFIPLGDHRDVTLAPYLSTNGIGSLGFRYRQAFRTGGLTLTGALSFDSLIAGNTAPRGFARLQGQFALPYDFTLRFDGQLISDRAYLRDYSLGNQDRVQSQITAERTQAGEYIGARALHWQSLRADQTNEVTPLAAEVLWRRTLVPDHVGGLLQLEMLVGAQLGVSALPQVRPMTRAALVADWRRDAVLPGGVLAAVGLGLRADFHAVPLSVSGTQLVADLSPMAMAELRWPLRRVTGSGATEILEPIAQVVWSPPQNPATVPNEDSTLVSFDEGNLFAPSRFSGIDRREGGARANLGLGWTRLDTQGRSITLQAGRIYRFDALGQFTTPSGLSGRWSDWLVSAHVDLPSGWSAMARTAFNDGFDVSRAELRARLEKSRYGLGSALVWASADLAENRPTPTAEWLFDGRYALTPQWTLRAGSRFDISSGQVTAASGGVQFANECLRVDLSLSRRFTSSNNVAPNTEFGLTFDFAGFGGSQTPGPARRRCG